MTTEKMIQCHYFNHINQVMTELQSQHSLGLLISLSPLMLPNYPHSHPIQYFFNLLHQPNDDCFKFHQQIQRQLSVFAPASLHANGLNDLASDLFQSLLHGNDCDASVPWLMAAIHAIQGSSEYKKIQSSIAILIERTAQWIQHHYHSVLFFGFDHRTMPLAVSLIEQLPECLSVGWGLPGNYRPVKRLPLSNLFSY